MFTSWFLLCHAFAIHFVCSFVYAYTRNLCEMHNKNLKSKIHLAITGKWRRHWAPRRLLKDEIIRHLNRLCTVVTGLPKRKNPVGNQDLPGYVEGKI